MARFNIVIDNKIALRFRKKIAREGDGTLKKGDISKKIEKLILKYLKAK